MTREPTKEELFAHYHREFQEMTMQDFGLVLANMAEVDAEQRAKLLPIDAVIGRVEALLDAADGDSSDALQTCLEALQEESRRQQLADLESEQNYEISAARQSSAARNV